MTDDKPPPLKPSFTDAAKQAMLGLQQDKRATNRAARLLLASCGGRLKRYFKQHSFRMSTEEDLDELLSDTVMAFVTQPIPQDCSSADAWLFAIAYNKVTDWVRKRLAEKRGAGVLIDVDDETLGGLLGRALGYFELPPWVKRCVEMAADRMQQASPQNAEVLYMVADGWSAEEIAVHFGANPREITAQQLTNARDRRYRAKLKAQEFFKHCLE